jgi:hypothetical protein
MPFNVLAKFWCFQSCILHDCLFVILLGYCDSPKLMRKGSQRSGIIWLHYPLFIKLQQVSVYFQWLTYNELMIFQQATAD